MKLAWLVAVPLALIGCGSPTAPDGDPRMVGDVMQIGYDLLGSSAEGPLQIHVKSDPADECGIVFSIDDRTWIGHSTDGFRVRAGEDILAEGVRVEVWFGLVLDSCPGQSHADALNRLE